MAAARGESVPVFHWIVDGLVRFSANERAGALAEWIPRGVALSRHGGRVDCGGFIPGILACGGDAHEKPQYDTPAATTIGKVKMKIAVIGTSGQLGFDLARILPGRGHEVVGFSGRAEWDVCDAAAFGRMLEERRPGAVINTAAFHNVDSCETEV